MIDLKPITASFLPQRDQDHMRYVGEAIKLALSPWNPGKVTAYISHPDSSFDPVVVIETELLPRLPFAYQMDLLGMDDHQNFAKMADEAFQWFRYRPARPINNDSIILGEE